MGCKITVITIATIMPISCRIMANLPIQLKRNVGYLDNYSLKIIIDEENYRLQFYITEKTKPQFYKNRKIKRERRL